MESLRIWAGGTDTTLPDFSTPIGGSNQATPASDSNSSFFSSPSSIRASVPTWVPFIGNSEAEQQENGCFPSFTWTQRIIGFVVLLLVGIMFCGFVRPYNHILEVEFHAFRSAMVIISPRSFAKYYTLGNLFIISSTFFLVGPRRQLANMFDSSRFSAAIAYFGSMAGTLFAAISVQSTILTLLLVIVQLCASVWYGSSYIPFAQGLIKSTATTILPL